MKITLYIDYRTTWGENVAVRFRAAGSDNIIKLSWLSGETWSGQIDVDDHLDTFEYNYLIVDDNIAVKRQEYGQPRAVDKAGNIPAMTRVDRWRDQPSDKPFCSQMFVDCVNKRSNPSTPGPLEPSSISLRVLAPHIAPSQRLVVAGNIDYLGNWQPENALRMADGNFPYWECQFPLADINSTDLEFKFVVVDDKNPSNMSWEPGENRRLSNIDKSDGSHLAVECAPLPQPATKWRGAGVAIPVFSLRSDDDFGVGDFYSLKKLADWCAATGQRIIQVLPVNDTTMTETWMDSYPYNANSSFALHPMYLHLQAIGQLSEPARRNHYAKIAAELNTLDTVDYEKVTRTKDLYARELFAQYGEETIASDDYRKFVNENKDWLTPYVAYRMLCRQYKTAYLADWGEYATYNPVKITRYIDQNRREANYHTFIQYHLSRQMSHVRDYAHSLGVAIKGDIPIGIARTSVDAWVNPRLYNMDCQAGAPPDAFSAFGQNWGFPTYNWDVMAQNNYEWWKSRFRTMARYFDAYRIDHVLGFFRIWQIPLDTIHGISGHFYPALPFTSKEMLDEYGFELSLPLHTRPYAADDVLDKYFGEFADYAKQHFLHPASEPGLYEINAEVATQRKVLDYFAPLPDTNLNLALAKGLANLIDNVLFIEDPQSKGHYHPRINAQLTDIYQRLDEHAKCCFDRLYNNFYYHRHNNFWRDKALLKLPPLIDATNMLVCAEDLGMIPACVPDVLKRLEILSLEIQRMPKSPNEEFANPADYPYYSVCTTSTHDMGGIRVWWTEDSAKTQTFFNKMLGRDGEAPATAESWICDQIIEQHLASPAMLCILPLQDWLSVDDSLRRSDPNEETINIPANPRHFWRYRMHLTIESLLRATALNSRLRSKIESSGR